MKTYPLLEKAPDHDTEEFVDYLRENNPVVFENPQWIVIENCKYHTVEHPWLTAFHKPRMVADKRGVGYTDWFEDIDILWFQRDWPSWNWLKKEKGKQSVRRFHIHIYK